MGLDPAKTITANLDDYLATKKQQADSGQIAYGWFSVARYHLESSGLCWGNGSRESKRPTLSNFHAHLLAEVQGGKMKAVYAKGVLTTVKTFMRWLWQNERLKTCPATLTRSVSQPTAP